MFNRFLDLHCPDCGGKIEEDARYCPHCGTDLDAPLGQNDPSIESVTKEYLDRAQQAYERGVHLDDALSDCELALESNPYLADAHNLRGLILDDMKRTNEAIEAYREALRLNPEHEDAKANLRDAEKELFGSTDLQQAVDAHDELENSAWPAIIKLAISALAAILVLALGGVLFVFGRQYLTPKTTIILEPDFTQVSTFTPEDLQRTAELLTERSQSLGYSRVTFTVTDGKEIAVQIPANIDVETFIKKVNTIGLVEFVNFETTPPDEGEIVRTDYEHKYLPQGQGKQWHTVMTNDEIQTVSVTQNQLGQYQVAFSLTEKGAEIFADYTSQHINTYLGIVLDKVVISVPIINSAILDGQGVIQGNFTKEKVDEVAAILKTTPLPILVKIKE